MNHAPKTNQVPQRPSARTASTGESAAARVDVEALGAQLLGRWADARRASRDLAGRPEVQGVPGLDMEGHRARVLSQLSYLVENGAIQRAFPARFGGSDDHGGNVAAFEELVLADPSLQIKAGVQWGLFGSAVLHLGTAEHHEKWLPGIMSLEVPGAFAMTETGHGSDVASIATTATYDGVTGEFVIDTPFRGAWKDYLGNAALHGRAAVVFAQLITRGVNHGVHAFYVPIRGEFGFLPGIGGEDDGLKGGLNGVDNGRLHFSRVRIPRTNLLNRYGDVAPDGTYSSPIASPARRFFTMLGTLVQGRVSLDGAAVAASKVGPADRCHLRQPAPPVQRLLRHRRGGAAGLPAPPAPPDPAHRHHLRRSVRARGTAGEVRRRLLRDPGHRRRPAGPRNPGRRAEAGLDLARPGHPAGVPRGLRRRRVPGREPPRLPARRPGRLRHLRGRQQRAPAAGRQAPARRLRRGVPPRQRRRAGPVRRPPGRQRRAQPHAVCASWPRRSPTPAPGPARPTAIKDADTQRDLLSDRVRTMVAEVGGALRGASKLPRAQSAQLFNRHQEEIIAAAAAHAELLQWEAFTRGLEQVQDPGTRTVLTWLRNVFGLCLIEKHLAWYLMQRPPLGAARAHRGPVRQPAAEAPAAARAGPGRRVRLRPRAPARPDRHRCRSRRQAEAMEYLRRLRASANAPVDEKALLAAR